MRRALLSAAVGAALIIGAAPASASFPVLFDNYCTVGSFKICASANVGLSGDGKTLTIDFWNNETVDSSADAHGESGTITAIGLYHMGAVPAALPPSTFSAIYGDVSGTIRTLTSWTNGASEINTIAGVELEEGGATKGHKDGIVGCTDPGPVSATHATTCRTLATAPYARFTFTYSSSIAGLFGSDNLAMRFHAKQVGPTGAMSVKCDTGITSGEHACMPDTTVPEPVSMVLMGTGLAGLAAVRRRRGESAPADA